MTFNIPTQTLGEVFQNQYPFHVPKYQRGYAWEQDELSDLLKDINSVQTSPKLPHFMGGLVHVHIQAANAVSRIHEVVDGQQRMATFTLLIAAVTHGISLLKLTATTTSQKQSCESHKEELDEAYLFFKETVNGKRIPKPKLIMSKVDEQFFADTVAGQTPSPTRETHRRIETAYELFRSVLVSPIVSDTTVNVKTRLRKLVDVAKRVADNFVVIHIVSQSRKEAYRLFSVLNDRGRNLSDGDLLRARTLEMTESDSVVQSRIEQKWDRILDGSEHEVERFLRAYYPSTMGKRAPSSGLYDAYEIAYLNGKSTPQIEDFVTQLAKEKRYFDDISNGLWPFQASSCNATAWDKDRLDRLIKVLRHEAAHPLLMSAMYLGEKKFISILHFLERFVFRYINVTGAHPGPIYAPYYFESTVIRQNAAAYLPESLRQKLKQLLIIRAPDQQFVESLTAKLQYSDDSARNRLIKHFLTTVEAYLGSANAGKTGKKLIPNVMTVFDLASTTLEHIYPQKPDAANVDANLAESVNKLGNLTVLAGSDNSNIGNFSFASKKTTFLQSSVALNHEIGVLSNWDNSNLTNREARLRSLALIVFDL